MIDIFMNFVFSVERYKIKNSFIKKIILNYKKRKLIKKFKTKKAYTSNDIYEIIWIMNYGRNMNTPISLPDYIDIFVEESVWRFIYYDKKKEQGIYYIKLSNEINDKTMLSIYYRYIMKSVNLKSGVESNDNVGIYSVDKEISENYKQTIFYIVKYAFTYCLDIICSKLIEGDK